MDESTQTEEVSSYTEIIKVPLDAARQRDVLLWYRLVSVATTPIVDGLLGPPQTPHTGFAGRLPSTIPESSTPKVREPQEIESAGPFALVGSTWPTMVYEASLIRMQL